MTRKDILEGKGVISLEKALEKAREEYDLYQKNRLCSGEKDFLNYLNRLERVAKKEIKEHFSLMKIEAIGFSLQKTYETKL